MTGASRNINQIIYFLLVLSLFGAVVLPSIEVHTSLPKIEISDISFPILTIFGISYFGKEISVFFRQNRWMYYALISLIMIAVVGLILNRTYGHVGNLFEPIKLLKLGVFIFFFAYFLEYKQALNVVKTLFILVLVFNFLHYFNVLNFNAVVEPFYAPPHHLDLFGMNSIGQASTKRMLGTLGNPNNNAVLFLSFLVLFIPGRSNRKINNLIFPILAIAAIVMCQSRSGFLAFAALLLFYVVFVRPYWQHALIIFGASLVIFTLNYYAGNSYVSTVGDLEVMEKAGHGRMYQWRRIIESVRGNWLLGRGIDKSFMRTQEIHPESEYFLILFRYGLLGLVVFVFFYGQLFFSTLKKIGDRAGILVPGIIIIFGVTGITNTPLQSPKLSVIFALIIGLGLRSIYERKKI